MFCDRNIIYENDGNIIYDKENYTCYISPYVDLDGNAVERTKTEYPYSYSPYVIWKSEYQKEKSHWVYSDRLFQWDCKKYNECSKKIQNNNEGFDVRSPIQVEKFLILYFEKSIKLTAIMEGCNVSSGFPYWIFVYEDVE